MRLITQMGVASVPNVTVSAYEINKACPKCGLRSVNIKFAGKGQEVLLMDHAMKMIEEGFMSHCNFCDFEFIQYITDAKGIIPQLLDSVLLTDLRILVESVCECPEKNITPELQGALGRLRTYVEHYS